MSRLDRADQTDRTEAGWRVLADCADTYQTRLSDRLLAAYAVGSLAHGGYAPAVSDIDLALILADPAEAEAEAADPGARRAEIESIWTELRARYPKLSVFFSSLSALADGRADGRFPALDRLDLAEHGQLLCGAPVVDRVARPGAAELLVDSSRFAVGLLTTEDVLAEFARPDRLLRDTVLFTKAVLFAVRFRYSAAVAVDRAASNDEAIAWYLDSADVPGRDLVRLAAAVRAGAALDAESATAALAAGLVPLYLGYLDDQLPRLRDAGAPDELITAFSGWRQRLIAMSDR